MIFNKSISTESSAQRLWVNRSDWVNRPDNYAGLIALTGCPTSPPLNTPSPPTHSQHSHLSNIPLIILTYITM